MMSSSLLMETFQPIHFPLKSSSQQALAQPAIPTGGGKYSPVPHVELKKHHDNLAARDHLDGTLILTDKDLFGKQEEEAPKSKLS